MGDRMATIDTGRKLEECCAPLGKGAGSPSNTTWPGPMPTFFLRTKWHLDPPSRLARIDMGRKVGAAVPRLFWEGKLGTHQHNVPWAEAYLPTKWHLDPSNRLAAIHQRYRQDRTRQTGQTDRQRFDSIGRTVKNLSLKFNDQSFYKSLTDRLLYMILPPSSRHSLSNDDYLEDKRGNQNCFMLCCDMYTHNEQYLKMSAGFGF